MLPAAPVTRTIGFASPGMYGSAAVCRGPTNTLTACSRGRRSRPACAHHVCEHFKPAAHLGEHQELVVHALLAAAREGLAAALVAQQIPQGPRDLIRIF